MASATSRLVAAAAIVVCGCSGGGSSTETQVPASTIVATSAPSLLPRVDLINEALDALEARLGGPQRYFEINATSQLVNLIVALNDGKVAQPWVFVGGELSSTEGQEASGFSFERAALDFDPDKVLTGLQAELPQSSPDLFFVEGGDGDVVRYSVAVTSQQGGQLIVVVGPDGTVLSVDAN